MGEEHGERRGGGRRGFRTYFGWTLNLLTGLLAGFFILFNSVFSDSSGLTERLITLALAAVVYCLAGAVGAWLVGRFWPVVLTVSAPGVLILLLYSFREPQNIWLHAAYALVSTLACWLGARLAAHTRRVRNA